MNSKHTNEYSQRRTDFYEPKSRVLVYISQSIVHNSWIMNYFSPVVYWFVMDDPSGIVLQVTKIGKLKQQFKCSRQSFVCVCVCVCTYSQKKWLQKQTTTTTTKIPNETRHLKTSTEEMIINTKYLGKRLKEEQRKTSKQEEK